jgi:hypothetical protein
MLVPLLIVTGIVGTDGIDIIVMNAPEPMPDGLEVP